jgi:WD40 repeat protein
MSERDIFTVALRKEDPAERLAYLDQACGGDAALRRRIEALLSAEAGDASVLVPPAGGITANPPSLRTNTLGPLPQAGGGAPLPGEDSTRAAKSEPSAGRDDNPLALLAPSEKQGSLGRLDHYEVEEVLGRGGMGIVFRAFDEKLRRVVAIKVLAPQVAASGTARKRFAREAQAAAAVRDEHVVDIHAVSEAGPVPYLVMEHVAGISLDERIRRDGAPEVKEILRIGLQTARGLAAAHAQGLIHRDIKPGNILLEDGVQRVKITDFGLARAADDASITQSGVIAGTPLYMSPEQARGEAVDHRTDLFSLGSVLYTLCTGRPAFRAGGTMAVLKRVCEDVPRPIREINPDVPDWLAALVAKLLAKDREQRFQSASEVADLLSGCLAHVQQPHTMALPPVLRALPPAPRRRRAAAALTAALVLVAVAGGLALWLRPRADGPPPRPHTPSLAERLAQASPFDGRKREEIPPALLALAGGGDPAQAPPELVAVLGSDRFVLPRNGPVGRMAQSPDGALLAVACGATVVLFDARTGSYLRSLMGLNGRVMPVAFSPDSRYVAAGCRREARSAAEDNRVQVWDAASGREKAVFLGHTAGVWSIVFSPDGKRLYSAGEDGVLRVWDVAGKTSLPPFAGPSLSMKTLALSADGKQLAAGGWGGRVQVWSTETGELRKTLEGGYPGAVQGVAFSPDGALLACGAGKATQIWTTATWEKRHALPVPGEWLAFSPDGRTLFTAPRDAEIVKPYEINLWNAATGARKGTYTLNSQGGYPAYCLSGDGRTLFAMRCNPPEPSVRRYDAATGKEHSPPPGHRGLVHAVAVSPDGTLLASGSRDQSVKLWDLAGWKSSEALPPVQTLHLHPSQVTCVAFSPDGQVLAGASGDPMGGETSVILWSVPRRERIATLRGTSSVNLRLAFSPDSKTVAVGCNDGSVRLWEVATGEQSAPPLVKHTARVRCVAFSADGTLLASGGDDGRVVLTAMATGRTLHEAALPRIVNNVAFSPDGGTLAAVTDGPDPALRLWEIAAWKERALPGHHNHVHGLDFCPAAPLLATGGWDGRLRFWEHTSRAPRTLTLLTDGAYLTFTPEGRYLVAGNANGTISVLKVPQPPPPYDPAPTKLPEAVELAGRPSAADRLRRADVPADLLKQAGGGDPARAPAELVAVLGGKDRHAREVYGMTIRPDGQELASCSADGTLKLWELGTGRCRRTVKANQGACRGVAFSPDGKLLASVGDDRQVKLWDAAGEPVRSMDYHSADWLDRVAFSPDGATLAAAGGAGTVEMGEVRTGKLLRSFTGQIGQVWGLAFSPDGSAVASVGGWRPNWMAGEVKLWDARRGWELSLGWGHTLPVRGVAFAPGGRKLATCGDDKSIRLWDLATAQHEVLLGHDAVVKAVAWRPDGQLLASAGADGTLRLWGVGGGAGRPCKVIPILLPGKWLNAIDFTPEGRHVVTANPDGTLYVLRLAGRGEAFEVRDSPGK